MDRRFIVNRQGKDFVLYAGLLDEAHSKGLKSIRTQLLQMPSEGNGNTAITGITRAKAQRIWYVAATEYFTSGTSYADAMSGTLNAAADLYGAGSSEVDAVIAAWAAVSAVQVQYWQNSLALWERAAAVTRDNHRAHANLAELMERQGNIDRAIAEYTEGIRIVPVATDLRKRLSLLLIRQDRLPEAADQLLNVVRIDPADADARNNLGVILEKQGRPDDALAQYSEALRLRPADARAHANVADVLGQMGRFADAAAEYRESLRIEPRHRDRRYNLAITLYRLGETREAIQQLNAVLENDPAFEPARRALQQMTK
jgi:tetratricopeptide (TPR) repeat protein